MQKIENLVKIRTFVLSAYPAIFFLFIFLLTNQKGWSWFPENAFLSEYHFNKGLNYFSILFYSVALFGLALGNKNLTLDINTKIIFALLLLCLASAVVNQKLHYSFLMGPLCWTMLTLFSNSHRVNSSGLDLLFILITIFCFANFVHFVWLFHAEDLMLSKTRSGELKILLQSYPVHIESSYMGFFSALIVLYAVFKKTPFWTLLGVFGFLNLIAADNRSSILCASLGLMMYSVIGFKFSIRGVVFRLLLLLSTFLASSLLLDNIFSVQVGPTSSVQDHSFSECSYFCSGETFSLAGENDFNAEVANAPVGGIIAVDPQILEKHPGAFDNFQKEKRGRTYNHFFQSTGGRLHLWMSGIERGLKSPFLGNGHFGSPSLSYVEGFNSPYSSVGTLYHNSFLQVFIDYGSLTLLLWLMFLGLLFFASTAEAKTIIFSFCVYFSFQNEFLVGQPSFFVILFIIIIPRINSLYRAAR